MSSLTPSLSRSSWTRSNRLLMTDNESEGETKRWFSNLAPLLVTVLRIVCSRLPCVKPSLRVWRISRPRRLCLSMTMYSCADRLTGGCNFMLVSSSLPRTYSRMRLPAATSLGVNSACSFFETGDSSRSFQLSIDVPAGDGTWKCSEFPESPSKRSSVDEPSSSNEASSTISRGPMRATMDDSDERSLICV